MDPVAEIFSIVDAKYDIRVKKVLWAQATA